MSDSLKQQAEEKFKEFWETWASRSPGYIDDILGHFSEEFIGFGTESGEKWLSMDAIRTQFESEHKYIPDPITISFKTIDTRLVENIVTVLGDLNILFNVEDRVFEMDPFRAKFTFLNSENGLVVISAATSTFMQTPGSDSPFPGLDEPKRYEEASILFTDFQKFTNMVGTIPPKKLVSELDEIFSEFDDIIKRNGLMKVKTIGDAYMAVGGLSEDHLDPAIDAVMAAKQMISYLEKRNQDSALKWDLRTGIHSGPVIGGVIGTHGLSFDIWGDSVNIASHIEQAGEAGRINLSAYTYDLVRKEFECEYRGKIEAKGKGPMDMYFVR